MLSSGGSILGRVEVLDVAPSEKARVLVQLDAVSPQPDSDVVVASCFPALAVIYNAEPAATLFGKVFWPFALQVPDVCQFE